MDSNADDDSLMIAVPAIFAIRDVEAPPKEMGGMEGWLGDLVSCRVSNCRQVLACLLVLGWMGLPTPVAAAGALRFESKRVEIKVAPEQEAAEVSFSFTNEGTTPARIESVQSDCTCLKAKAPDGEISPGARGVVSSEFRVGSLRGVVEKHLWVKVRQAGETRRILLDAVLVVPEMVKVEPRTLSWTSDEELSEKSFKVMVTAEEAIKLLDVECSREDFAFRVEAQVVGREYVVHARPLKADRPSIALVRFETDCRIEKFKTPMGFVCIRRP